MSAILKFDFKKKKRTITFFWSYLSKLHKKPNGACGNYTFSLKQGETRTSHGPIPHPLVRHVLAKLIDNSILIYWRIVGIDQMGNTWDLNGTQMILKKEQTTGKADLL